MSSTMNERKCCCCAYSRGCIAKIFAILDLIAAVGCVAYLVYPYPTDEEAYEMSLIEEQVYEVMKYPTPYIIAMMVVKLLMALILIAGTFQRSQKLLNVWRLMMFIFLLWIFCKEIIRFTVFKKENGIRTRVIFLLLYYIYSFYEVFVVCELYEQMKPVSYKKDTNIVPV